MTSISLKTFTDLAGKAANQETGFLKVSGGRLTETGRLGNFFTTQATRRETISAFTDAVRAEYGDHIADMVVGGFTRVLEKEGKPLTARLVRDLSSLAEKTKSLEGKHAKEVNEEKVSAQNRAVVENFLSGADPAESPLGLAVKEMCAQKGLTSPDDQAVVRKRVAGFLADKAAQGGFDPKAFTNPRGVPIVLTAQALKAGIINLNQSYTGFTTAHKDALGLPGGPLPGALPDRLRLADLMGSGNNKGLTAFHRSLGKLEAMRTIQPDGQDIRPETVYQAFFRQAPSAGRSGEELLKAVETRCAADKQAVQRHFRDNGKLNLDSIIATWAPHLPWERLAPLLARPAAITTGDAVVKWCEEALDGIFDRSGEERLLQIDPHRGQGDTQNPPIISFQLDDGQGGTRTETIEFGSNTRFIFTDEADREAYHSGLDNSLSRRLAALSQEICGPGASEAQVTGVMGCLGFQTFQTAIGMAIHLAGADDLVGRNPPVSVRRSPDGAVLAEISSSPDVRDSMGQFHINLSIAPDGRIRITNFELTPPLDIRELPKLDEGDPINIAIRKARQYEAADFCALDTSPDGLFAQIQARAQALDPGAKVEPESWSRLAAGIIGRLEKEMIDSGDTLTPDQKLKIRQEGVDAFFDKLTAATAQIPPEQRATFTRFCLEIGEVPDKEMLPVSLAMADTVTNAFRGIIRARDAGEARDQLEALGAFMRNATFEFQSSPIFGQQGNDQESAGKGPDDFLSLRGLSMRLGVLNLMGRDSPAAFARALSRPGPFRDMVRTLGPNDLASVTLQWAVNGLANILPDEVLIGFESNGVRERDLSLPRQREILGEGVYVARGLETNRAMPELAGLNQSLKQDMPTITAHVRAVAETNLTQGPVGGRTDPNDPQSVSVQFSKDYERLGCFVNGRYYHPNPKIGTGTSEKDFVALFPDAHTAGRLSNLAAQNLPGFLAQAVMANEKALAKETFKGISENMYNNGYLQGGDQDTQIHIDTLNAAQGRYRITGCHQAVATNAKSAIERLMYEVSVEVTLGAPGTNAQPAVEDARVDLLFRGREAVPGEPEEKKA